MANIFSETSKHFLTKEDATPGDVLAAFISAESSIISSLFHPAKMAEVMAELGRVRDQARERVMAVSEHKLKLGFEAAFKELADATINTKDCKVDAKKADSAAKKMHEITDKAYEMAGDLKCGMSIDHMTLYSVARGDDKEEGDENAS